MRVGMHLGPFYASTSVGGRRPRRRRPSGGLIGGYLQLVVWMLQLCIWMTWASLVICYWTIKGAWIGGVWLAGQISAATVRRRQAQEVQLQAAERAAEEEHSRLVASLRPEDVDFLRENGWQGPKKQLDALA